MDSTQINYVTTLTEERVREIACEEAVRMFVAGSRAQAANAEFHAAKMFKVYPDWVEARAADLDQEASA